MTQVSVFYNGSVSSVDGSVLFVINQFGLTTTQGYSTISMDLSTIPTLGFPTGNVFAFLMCSPNASIQTHQVRATGNGNLTLGKTQPSQGNIDLTQANYLLSSALLKLATDSGPTTNAAYGQMGTDLMEWFIFGYQPSFFNLTGTDPIAFPPAPLSNITAVYKQIIQSAMKSLLSGAIGTANVTGGVIGEQMVFSSSLGHVYISAASFAFLTIALVAAQFRKRRVAFTLVNVAAALADSDVPQKCVEMTGTGEGKVLKLVQSGDGQLNCAYQSTDTSSDIASITDSTTVVMAISQRGMARQSSASLIQSNRLSSSTDSLIDSLVSPAPSPTKKGKTKAQDPPQSATSSSEVVPDSILPDCLVPNPNSGKHESVDSAMRPTETIFAILANMQTTISDDVKGLRAHFTQFASDYSVASIASKPSESAHSGDHKTLSELITSHNRVVDAVTELKDLVASLNANNTALNQDYQDFTSVESVIAALQPGPGLISAEKRTR
jgi:hypothetical protein